MLHSPLAFIDAEACAYDNHCKQFPETPYVPSECYEHCALNRASPAIPISPDWSKNRSPQSGPAPDTVPLDALLKGSRHYEMAGMSQSGHTISGSINNRGFAALGNNFSVGGSVYFSTSPYDLLKR